MRVPLSWLREYVAFDGPADDLARRLTLAGLEVGGIDRPGEGVEGVVVARILEKGPHPAADRLSLCRVTDGDETYDIVCGATNMTAGDTVALARVGARLPGGLKIKKAKIRGQVSYGMMCSERELGLGDEHSGILILPADLELGRSVTEVLGLPDAVLEVEITPNRADCLSVVGVAREVAALCGLPLRVPEPQVPEAGDPVHGQTSVEIYDPDLCHRYAARIVRGVRLGPSPLWLRRRLEACGVRAINNVVDVTNYVLLELGHPLHAFDLGRLAGGRIVVQRARPGDRFTTLDGQERVLDADTLMIWDAERPVAVAGVMGGMNSEVEDDTTDLLIESAYFLPANIRRTAKRLGLKTEASYRFERGTDIEGLLRALDRCAELVADLAGGKVATGIWDAYPTRHEPVQVRLRHRRVQQVLGCPVPADETVRCLASLGMRVLGQDAASVEVEVPFHRVDVTREIDLVEEVARLHGYDAIPTTLPRVAVTGDGVTARRAAADRVRDVLAAEGLFEAVTYSFVDPADDDRLGLPGDAPDRNKVVLQNPLGRDTSVLRTSLVPSLLRALGLNLRRRNRDARLFEVGRTFHPEHGGSLPREALRAAGVLAGRRFPLAWWAGPDTVDFFDARAVVERALGGLGVRSVRFEPAGDLPWLHPGRAARIVVGAEVVGWVGQIHPDRLGAFDLDEPAVAFELDLDRAATKAEPAGSFPGLGRFPAAERDLAIVVDRSVTVQQVLDEIEAMDSPLVRGAVLFDAFEGGRLPEGKVSLALRVTYRSDERTLTEEEVREVEAALLARLSDRLGARLRDV